MHLIDAGKQAGRIAERVARFVVKYVRDFRQQAAAAADAFGFRIQCQQQCLIPVVNREMRNRIPTVARPAEIEDPGVRDGQCMDLLPRKFREEFPLILNTSPIRKL